MNLGSDPADQVVRYSMAGTEVVLKLSGLAAKNLALLLMAVLKDQKKTRGKTRLIRMLKDGRPPRFFDIPTASMKEFAKEAKTYGLLFVAFKDKKNPAQHEIMVFADDAAKIQRIMDRMGIDYVKAERACGEVESTEIETAKEEDFSSSPNFTPAREKWTAEPPMSENPSKPSSPSNGFSGQAIDKRSVREELSEIKQEVKMKNKLKNRTKDAPVPKQKKVKGER